MPTIRTAALSIAETIDVNLARLRAAAARLPVSASPGEVCDVVDVGPVCVGGTGPNLYSSEKLLLIDLGGNDVYNNSAGGGTNLVPGFFPVSVNLDLAGNDTYDHEVLATDDFVPSQGSGTWGGVGILVDAEGDDSYKRRFRTGEGVLSGGQPAQGAAELGVGLLGDISGNDTYSVEVTEDILSLYQGAANGPGASGVLLDRGNGNDAYSMTGAATVDSSRLLYGQGLGMIGGTGVLADGGGSDAISASVTTEVPEGIRSYEQLLPFSVPDATILGQGSGFIEGAVGVLLTGEGPTTFSAQATGRGLALHRVWVQGMAANGTGILDDSGGDDVYLMRSDMTAAAHAAADAGCACQADVSVDAGELLNAQDLTGQGAGGVMLVDGVVGGFLHDHGGDDRYTAVQEGRVTAEARAVGPGLAATAEAISFNAGPVAVQGAGEAGAGILVDESGDDHYLVRVDQRASARALADQGEPAEARAEADQRDEVLLLRESVVAQGATRNDTGSGVLADLDGADRYEVAARTEAEAFPTPGGASESRGLGPFQGSGASALLLDRDEGAPDAFVSEPNFYETCSGRRGEPMAWSECPSYRRGLSPTSPLRPLGSGVVTSAPTKRDIALELRDVRQIAEVGLLVAGTLAGPEGQPLAERFIDIRLQGQAAGLLPGHPTRWKDVTATHSWTDANGRWEAALRVSDLQAAEGISAPFRLWVGFAGDETLRAAVDTEAFSPSGGRGLTLR